MGWEASSPCLDCLIFSTCIALRATSTIPPPRHLFQSSLRFGFWSPVVPSHTHSQLYHPRSWRVYFSILSSLSSSFCSAVDYCQLRRDEDTWDIYSLSIYHCYICCCCCCCCPEVFILFSLYCVLLLHARLVVKHSFLILRFVSFVDSSRMEVLNILLCPHFESHFLYLFPWIIT